MPERQTTRHNDERQQQKNKIDEYGLISPPMVDDRRDHKGCKPCCRQTGNTMSRIKASWHQNSQSAEDFCDAYKGRLPPRDTDWAAL